MTPPEQSTNSPVAPPGGRTGILALFLEPRAAGGERVACLDGFRGIAVALVVLSHLDNAGVGITSPLSWSGAGKYGVYLFFVLSSFLLASQLSSRSDEQLRSMRVWRDYAIRRALRIYPAYAAVLLALVALHQIPGLAVKSPSTLAEVYDHLTLRAGAEVFWTIPIECKFYFVLPLIVAAEVFLLRRRPALVAAALSVAVALSATTLGRGFDAHVNRTSLAQLFDVFLIGCLVAHLHAWLLRRGQWTPLLRWGGEAVAWLALAGVLLQMPKLWASLGGDEIALTRFQATRMGLLWALCLLATLHGRGALAGVMSLPPLRFLGAISFSLYLWHYTVLVLVQQRLPQRVAAVGWLVIGLSLVVAVISYLLTERPSLSLGRRLVTRGRRSSTGLVVPIGDAS